MHLRETIVNNKKNSYLFSGKFTQPDVLDACVAQVQSQLEITPPITVFGKLCKQRRDIGFFCDTPGVEGYNYSTQIMRSKPIPEALQTLMQIVNTHIGASYNAILVNRYIDGNNYIGKHSDDETYLDPVGGVFLISWGATRKFRIREKGCTGFIDIPTGHMDAIHMTGNFQKHYTHEIPVEKKVCGERYSFTFRHHMPTL